MRKLLFLALVGCAGDAPTDDGSPHTGTPTTTTTLVDVGEACLHDSAFGGVQADQAGEVRVSFACVGCFTTDVDVSCSASLQGSDLVVTGRAVLSVAPTPTTIACTCRDVEATCPAPALPAGAYTLTYGGDGVPFDVPAPGPVCAHP